MESTLKSEEEWKVVRVEKKGDPFNVPEGFDIVEMDESNFLQFLPRVQHLLKPDMQQGMEGGTIKFARKIGTRGNEDDKPKTKQENPLGDLLGVMGGLMTAFGMSQEDAAVMKSQGDQLFGGLETVLKGEATETVDSVLVSYEIPIVNGKPIYEWKNMGWRCSTPKNALIAGKDGRKDVFVGRMEVNGKLHLGKVHNDDRYVIEEWYGAETKTLEEKYEVLCVDPDVTVSWVDCEHFVNGEVPHGAVGWSNDGKDQYVGRGTTEKQITPGKIVPKDRCMYAPYGNTIHKLTKYEVLIIKESTVNEIKDSTVNEVKESTVNEIKESTVNERDSEEEWKVVRVEKKGDQFNVPEGFDIVQMDESNFLQYLPKVQHLLKPDMQQGMEGGTIKFARKIRTSGNDDEKPKAKQENPLGELLGVMGGLMTAFGMSQGDAGVLKNQSNQLLGGFLNQSDQLLEGLGSVLIAEETETVDAVLVPYEIPSVNGKPAYEWKKMGRNEKHLVPRNALAAGKDQSETFNVFVGRGELDRGTLHLGKVHNGERYVVAPLFGVDLHYGEKKITDERYEVLCVDPDATVSWVDCAEFVVGEVPDGAVGWTTDGEDQYVGRGITENQLTPGKIVPKDGSMYAPYGGPAWSNRMSKYEVLIIKA